MVEVRLEASFFGFDKTRIYGDIAARIVLIEYRDDFGRK